MTGEGAPTDDAYTICIEGPAPSTDTACRTIVGEGTVTFEELDPGRSVVSETDPGDEYEVTITSAAVDVTIGGLATATVTNEFTEQQSLPPTPEVQPPTVPETPVTPETPTAVVTPETPVSSQAATEATPATSAAPTNVAAQTALPATGSEGGLAAVAMVLVGTGVGLMWLSRRREPLQARFDR